MHICTRQTEVDIIYCLFKRIRRITESESEEEEETEEKNVHDRLCIGDHGASAWGLRQCVRKNGCDDSLDR